jgi:hypothetical protein
MRKTRYMASWSRLRDALASVDDSITFAWDDLDALVGGLPRSAYDYAAFWKGDRSSWSGFTTVDVRVGESVTFVRRAAGPAVAPEESRLDTLHETTEAAADLLLVGCVELKLDQPAPARDLYISPLFRKERDYAERSGLPWFVLSAEYGLVAPDTVIAPYNLHLAKTSRAYRREWGNRVLIQLREAVGPLSGKVLEIHAAAVYVAAIRGLLNAEGATVVDPLKGLTFGRRLSWYGSPVRRQSHKAPPAADSSDISQLDSSDISQLVDKLRDGANAKTPAEFLESRGSLLRSPGLYSWWVDSRGASDLQAGLDQSVAAGLIYAGLAGATRSRSRRKSTNTLWGRIRGMHLGGRHDFSTFRLSLGSILANACHESDINEDRLTSWMHQHLRVIAIPIADADGLNALEREVLQCLDPPLNLDKVERTLLRMRLSELRRQYGRNTLSASVQRGNRH